MPWAETDTLSQSITVAVGLCVVALIQVVSALLQVLTTYLQARTKAAVEKANDDANMIAMKAATKAEEARRKSMIEKEAISEKIDEQARVLEENTKITKVVHDLVNSGSLEQRRQHAEDKRQLWILAKQIASLTPEPDDSLVMEAEMQYRTAERVYQEHLAKQAVARQEEQ